MLITLKELLADAEKRHVAYGAFNAPNYETALAVIEAGEELNLPVILSPGPGHDCYVNFDHIMAIYQVLAEKAAIDVCIHLDHCQDLAYIKKALKAGVTSVMYDGSHFDFATNIKNTQEVVALAKPYGASVEAELGTVATSAIGQPETAHISDEAIYTDPAEAEEFVKQTGIDALAVAIGTVHGVYVKEPVLDLPRIKEIKERVKIPLVMHGGSGIAANEVKQAIANGINKINYYTYMAMAGGQAVKEYCANKDLVFFHDVSLVGKAAIKEDVLRVMRLFSL